MEGGTLCFVARQHGGRLYDVCRVEDVTGNGGLTEHVISVGHNAASAMDMVVRLNDGLKAIKGLIADGNG